MRAAKQAVRLLRGNERHILIGYGSVTAQAADTAKAILGKIRSGDLKTEFRSRDVWRPGCPGEAYQQNRGCDNGE
jgi:hypothetical protein